MICMTTQQIDTAPNKNTEELYNAAVKALSQRLVTYYKDTLGQIKRVEKTRTFKPSCSTITSIEVFE